MIRPHRTVHRFVWLLLAPLLLGLILLFSRPHTDLSPPNSNLTELPNHAAGKGALP